MISQTMQNKSKQRMTDKQMLYDVLISQQKAAHAYNRFAGENENSELCDIFMIISEDDIKLAQQVLSILIKNGWYNTVQAPEKDIMQVR